MASSSSANNVPTLSSSSPEKSKMIVLRSSDKGETFELGEAAARMSETVKNMIEDDCADDVIPLPNVESAALSRVVHFCRRVEELKHDEARLKEFKDEFMSDVKDDKSQLFSLILAANYLAIKELLDLTCQTTAEIIKDMRVEDVREYFDIENDYSPEEEEKVRKENQWAFD